MCSSCWWKSGTSSHRVRVGVTQKINNHDFVHRSSESLPFCHRLVCSRGHFLNFESLVLVPGTRLLRYTFEHLNPAWLRRCPPVHVSTVTTSRPTHTHEMNISDLPAFTECRFPKNTTKYNIASLSLCYQSIASVKMYLACLGIDRCRLR